MSRNKKSLSMHNHADWIMNCVANKEGAAKIAEKFNSQKRVPIKDWLTTEDVANFITAERERRAKERELHRMLVKPWTAEGMGAAV